MAACYEEFTTNNFWIEELVGPPENGVSVLRIFLEVEHV